MCPTGNKNSRSDVGCGRGRSRVVKSMLFYVMFPHHLHFLDCHVVVAPSVPILVLFVL